MDGLQQINGRDSANGLDGETDNIGKGEADFENVSNYANCKHEESCGALRMAKRRELHKQFQCRNDMDWENEADDVGFAEFKICNVCIGFLD